MFLNAIKLQLSNDVLHSGVEYVLASQYNNILILVTMTGTHNFPPKLSPWQPTSSDMSTTLLLTKILNIW